MFRGVQQGFTMGHDERQQPNSSGALIAVIGGDRALWLIAWPQTSISTPVSSRFLKSGRFGLPSIWYLAAYASALSAVSVASPCRMTVIRTFAGY
jgi:hypothetical protein